MFTSDKHSRREGGSERAEKGVVRCPRFVTSPSPLWPPSSPFPSSSSLPAFRSHAPFPFRELMLRLGLLAAGFGERWQTYSSKAPGIDVLLRLFCMSFFVFFRKLYEGYTEGAFQLHTSASACFFVTFLPWPANLPSSCCASGLEENDNKAKHPWPRDIFSFLGSPYVMILMNHDSGIINMQLIFFQMADPGPLRGVSAESPYPEARWRSLRVLHSQRERSKIALSM